MENWVRIPILISFNHVLEAFGSDNFTKVIMEALTIGGGMPKDQIVNKLMSFRTNDINVFQNTKSNVTKQIQDDYAPFSTGVHCMAHQTNLAMQTLSAIPLVKCIESLLQTLHAYFAHFPKRHLKFIKLTEIMETKGNKILYNVKTQWKNSMLSLTNRVMAEYKTLLLKMAMDNSTNQQVKLNFEHLCDLQIMFELACILPFLEFVHVLIKFI